MRLDWEEIDCIFVDMDDLDLPVMIPDLDIYRSANLLVKQHGQDAQIEAAMEADAMLEKGDLGGYAVWKQVLQAVEELRRMEAAAGTPVSNRPAAMRRPSSSVISSKCCFAASRQTSADCGLS